MKEKLPINPQVLKWARTSLRLSLQEVAQRFGAKSRVEVMQAWENGEGSPTYPQLERLAHEIYRRPVAVFFFPIVPEEESPKAEFRALPDTKADELPPEIVRLYRKAKLLQLYLEELNEGKKPAATSLLDLFELSEKSDYTLVSKAIRRALGLSIEQQSRWLSAETAFKRWREAFEANGLFVFKHGFRNRDYSGFSLYHPKYPIVFVNNSMPDSRQVFTLFHEVGHLLYRVGGVDFSSRDAVRLFQGYYRDVEVSCNRFANEFLVPQEAFDSFRPAISEANFDRLADYFSVSREVILRKYLDRGLIDAKYYQELSSKWAAQTKQKPKPGGNYYYNQKAYLGERFINLVYAKYYQNRITANAVAEYLPKFRGHLT